MIALGRRASLVACLLALLVAPWWPDRGLAAPPSWGQVGRDSRHTGKTSARAPTRPGQRWVSRLESGPITAGPVVRSDGGVYVGSGGYVVAIGPGGALEWRAQLGTGVGAVMLGPDETVYATAGDTLGTSLYIMQPNGTQIGQFQATGATHASRQLALASDGTVYFTSLATDGISSTLYAIGLTPTVAARWLLPLDYVDGSSPAIAPDGTIYLGTYVAGGRLIAVNSNGSLRWQSEPLGFVNAPPSVDVDGSIYVGSASGGLYAVNPTGLVRWAYSGAGPVEHGGAALGGDGFLYVGAGERLLKLDADGRLIWQTTCLPGGKVVTTPAVDLNHNVLVQAIVPGGTPSAQTCLVNQAGTALWSWVSQYGGLNGPAAPSPAIWANDALYLAGPDGSVQSLTLAVVNPAFRVRLAFLARNSPVARRG